MAPLKRVLLCGHRALAAQGLRQALSASGHEVWETSRGPLERRGQVVTGPLADLPANPHLPASFDCVVNYVVLAGEDAAANAAWAATLLHLCAARGARHLIQISSLSVVRDDSRRVDEAARSKTAPARSGPYAAAKIAAELALLRRRPADVHVSLVRPGRILAAGMRDPAAGLTVRAGRHTHLLLGRPDRPQPLITRATLHTALTRLVAAPPASGAEILLLVDPGSPAAADYVAAVLALQAPNDRLLTTPAAVWLPLQAARELRRGLHRSTLPRLRGAALEGGRRRLFDPSRSEARLGVSFADDWRESLRDWAAARSAGGPS